MDYRRLNQGLLFSVGLLLVAISLSRILPIKQICFLMRRIVNTLRYLMRCIVNTLRYKLPKMFISSSINCHGFRRFKSRFQTWEMVCAGAISYLFLFTFLIYLPYQMWDCANSPYFNKKVPKSVWMKKVDTLNAERLTLAQGYLGTLPNLDKVPKVNHSGHEFSIAAGIVSIKRKIEVEMRDDNGKLIDPNENMGYLTQTAGLWHALLATNKELLPSTELFICNVDYEPNYHEEARDLGMKIPVYVKHEDGGYDEAGKNPSKFEKEKLDYVFCLEKALALKTQYVLMLEDDVIPQSDFISVLTHMLKFRIKPPGHFGNNQSDDNHFHTSDWLFLKFYYPDKWRGYSRDIRHAAELIGITILGGCISLILARIVATFGSRQSRLYYLLFVTVGAIYSICLVVSIGRPYVLRMFTLHPSLYKIVGAPDCCTQAIVYHRSVVTELVKHLQSVKCTEYFSVDLAIDQFAKTRRLERLLVEPNVIKHIGMISTVRQLAKNPAQFL